MARPASRNRIKKRVFVVAGIVLAVVTLLAGLISILLASLIGPANLFRFQIDQQADPRTVLGSGLDLGKAASANFIRDSSFEPLIFRNALTLYGGDEDTLTVSSEEASAGLYGDGFFNGASVRIMTPSASGLTLKKTATVTHYGINRVGVFQTLNMPADVPRNRAINDFVRHGQQSVAVGKSGLVIRNVAGQTILSGSSGVNSDLTGVCAMSDGFLAVSAAGEAIHSADGASWKPWSVMPTGAFMAVAASDQDLAVAVGLEGEIQIGADGYLSRISSGTSLNLRSVTYGLSTFVAAGDGGALLWSTNGLVWEPVQGAPESDWRTVIFQDGRFLVVGTKGRIGLSDDGRRFTFLTVDSALDYEDAAMLSGKQLILLDSQGRFYISNDSGKSWQRSGIDTGMISRRIELIGNDKILSTDNTGRLGQAQIVAEIDLDSALQGQRYQAGDICFLEIGKTRIPENYLGSEAERARQTDPWQFQGPGTGERTSDEAAPAGGTASMRLTAASSTVMSSDATILTQRVDPALIRSRSRNQVYRIELFMRQEQIANRNVMAWISGSFAPVGTEFTNVGSAYKKYTFTFVLPVDSIGEEDDIRLNIGFYGTGTLWIDRVYFGPSSDPHRGLDKGYAESVLNAAPAFMRLGFLGLGSGRTASDAFARPADNTNPSLDSQGYHSEPVQSAAPALDLCIEANATPYLVIGPYFAEADMQNLLEYLCGPISEPYGQMRMNSGRVAPYADAFSRIILEINDPENLLSTDAQKAAYVNLLIRTIEQSPYYRQVKSKLVFVDGMVYQDGVLLSRADYHASDLTAVIGEDPVSSVEKAAFAYLDLIPRTPDRPEDLPTEIMRSTQVLAAAGSKVRMADLTSILTGDLGRYTSLACLTFDPQTDARTRQLTIAASRVVSLAAHGAALSVSPVSEAASTTGESVGSGVPPASGPRQTPVQAYAFMSGSDWAVILINAGSDPAIVQLSTVLPIAPGTVSKYDENGLLLSTQKLRRPNSRINLMAGGVAIIEAVQATAR